MRLQGAEHWLADDREREVEDRGSPSTITGVRKVASSACYTDGSGGKFFHEAHERTGDFG